MKKLSGVYYDPILDQVMLVTEIGNMLFVDNEVGRLIFKVNDFLPILNAAEKVGDL